MFNRTTTMPNMPTKQSEKDLYDYYTSSRHVLKITTKRLLSTFSCCGKFLLCCLKKSKADQKALSLVAKGMVRVDRELDIKHIIDQSKKLDILTKLMLSSRDVKLLRLQRSRDLELENSDDPIDTSNDEGEKDGGKEVSDNKLFGLEDLKVENEISEKLLKGVCE